MAFLMKPAHKEPALEGNRAALANATCGYHVRGQTQKGRSRCPELLSHVGKAMTQSERQLYLVSTRAQSSDESNGNKSQNHAGIGAFRPPPPHARARTHRCTTPLQRSSIEPQQSTLELPWTHISCS